ncbi:adenylate cyclase [Yersinia ruckeri]|uniref:CYTH domain-containing protein n=1 Tax=Yersinia ruckeri TaxID=29486 RepID=UPI0004E3491E|nr:inorganic triphosphatase [Yersinia ruckeri]AKA38289.1 adenylate cyclase [Yersinia ruckeri]ARY99850.1 CYTH domain protein [Yersinia ruckeri]AUQ41974.1 inorganic triphosphatase [Yersinia ruckeri]EKN4182492.1 inorganic triphosphatase [Yersinia ruckeri]EKN4199631.1 inorganic triphosphatase [Yersinia ruckeri]
MTVEIELKFIATPAAIAALPDQIASWPHEHSAPQTLTNIYFETEDNRLREKDMGLRIRGCDDHFEMTIKAGGKVVGGLHQRPEYNVTIDKPILDLARFPAEIWPADWDIAALQAELKPLFQTNFMREKWVVTYKDSLIELALDQGTINANDLSEALHEVELELKQGHQADLLALATELAQNGGLRQGSLSKAARGYHLAQGNPAREIRPLLVLQPPAKSTVEQGMVAGLEMALEHWQYHEELWLRGDAVANSMIIEALAMIRQVMTVFGGLVPRKASTELRALLTELEPLLAAKNADAEILCYSPVYLKCKLALTSWLVNAGWRPFIDAKGQAKFDGSFKRFADIMLSRSAADLKETFAHHMDDDGYLAQLPRLNRQILAFQLLSGFYPQNEWHPYIDGWFGLQQAIAERQGHWRDTARKEALSQPAFWLNGAAAR